MKTKSPCGVPLRSSGVSVRQPQAAFWLLAAVLFLLPLAQVPALQFFDVTPKLCVLLIGTCLVWLALVAENRFPPIRGSFSRFFVLLALLAVAATLATVFSQDPVLSLIGSEWRRLGLPAWLACLALAAATAVVVGEDRGRRKLLLASLVLSAMLAAAYASSQYSGYDPWIDPALYHVGEGRWQIVRSPSTLGHASYFAAFSLLALFGALGLALSAPDTAGRLCWGAAATALGLSLLISGSRGAWLGAALGMAALCGIMLQRRPLLVGLLGFTLLAAAFAVSPLGRPLVGRLISFVEDPGRTARLLIWRDTVHLILAHPWLGTGPDTYELTFPGFQSAELARHLVDYSAESPHNIFLDHLASVGVPATLLFMLLVTLTLKEFAAASRREPLDAALLAGLLAGLVASQFISETIPTKLALLVFAALSVPTPAASLKPPARAATCTVLLVCLALALLFAARMWRADHAVREASRAAAHSDWEDTLQSGHVAARVFPWSGTYAFAFSRILGQAAANPRLSPEKRHLLLAAMDSAVRESLSHPSQPQSVYVQLASLRVLQGKTEEALAALEAAARAAPTWYRPRWLLAVLLASRGRLREASGHAAAALELGARRYPEVAETCAGIRRAALNANR